MVARRQHWADCRWISLSLSLSRGITVIVYNCDVYPGNPGKNHRESSTPPQHRSSVYKLLRSMGIRLDHSSKAPGMVRTVERVSRVSTSNTWGWTVIKCSDYAIVIITHWYSLIIFQFIRREVLEAKVNLDTLRQCWQSDYIRKPADVDC